MLTLRRNRLVFAFPELHENAKLSVRFMRTFRIPDDNNEWPLPPAVGVFPLRHVDDYVAHLPATWAEHGGVFLPMYQSEALWIQFESESEYPFAVKIAGGKINAISGMPWRPELDFAEQDYVVVPGQPWLDGFCIAKGKVRQFVAMPLGAGFSVEEQVTGQAVHGGLQIVAYPLRPKFYNPPSIDLCSVDFDAAACLSVEKSEMGLAAGGVMKQDIYDDPHRPAHWDTEVRNRCFVHLLNSTQFLRVTGEAPPTEPFTADAYTAAGLPWFEYYADEPAIAGGEPLQRVQGVGAIAVQKGEPLPKFIPTEALNVVPIGRAAPARVREGKF